MAVSPANPPLVLSAHVLEETFLFIKLIFSTVAAHWHTPTLIAIITLSMDLTYLHHISIFISLCSPNQNCSMHTPTKRV